MVPRLKTRAVSKPAKSHLEPNVANPAAIARTPNPNRSMSLKTGKTRGRPVTINRNSNNGQKTKRLINQTTNSSSRDILTSGSNITSQNGVMRKSKSGQEDKATALEPQLLRTRGRPRRASTCVNKAVSGTPSDEKTVERSLPQLHEIPETQIAHPLIIHEGPQKRNNSKGPWIGKTDGRHYDESVIDDIDAMSLRNRLDDLNRRYENLQARHRDLWDIGVKAAELTFQRLKQQTDKNTQASNQLISHLREELVAQSQIVDQVEHLRNQLELSQAEANDLRATLANTSDELSECKCEIKAMSVKLAASRANEVHAKTANNLSKPTGPANCAHQEILQTTQAKEDLYCDLTGLILRDIKHGKKEDIYDCIQTGRNGSLHFKLALEKVEGNDYEDVQFTYWPQLDENRDSEVIEMLPEYLTEEITFPRPHASKFYTRVMKALTERLE